MSIAYSAASITMKDGATPAEFVVHRTGTTSELARETRVAYSTADVSAVAGVDYIATSGQLTFAPSEASKRISVEIRESAYDAAQVAMFLLNLEGYGTSTCSIQPGAVTPKVQTFLNVPEAGHLETIPTTSLITNDPHKGTTSEATDPPNFQNIKYQTDYSGFVETSKPVDALPGAYIRFGHARANMNPYERMIINTDAYVPRWAGYESDGTPLEMSTMKNLNLPRGIDRLGKSVEKVSAEMKENIHLDGVFIYSDKNYVVTIKNNRNQIIQGGNVLYVAGRSHQMYLGTETKWVYAGSPDNLRKASGTDRIGSQIWDYSISSNRSLNISSNRSIYYYLSDRFYAFAGAKIDVSNDVKYSVSNSIKMDIKGLQASISADVLGNFSINSPFLGYTATKKSVRHSVSEKIVLTVNSGLSTGWTTPVRIVAAANALAAAGATSAAWIDEFQHDGSFYRDFVSSDEMGNNYKDAFIDGVPDAVKGLAAATAVTVIICAALQKMTQTASSFQPKIEMDETGITLAANIGSSINITEDRILIVTPSLEVATSEGITLGSTGDIDVTAPDVTIEGASINIDGEEISLYGDASVFADLDVLGDLFALSLETA